MIFSRENLIYNGIFDLITNIVNLEKSKTINNQDQINKTWNIIISKIGHFNSQLDLNNTEDIDYIKNIIRKASNIPVKFTKNDGSLGIKNVSIIGGQFDINLYADTNNIEYRETTIEYYNIIKCTFNVFDIINTIPYYRDRFNNLFSSHNVLTKTSIKYRFSNLEIKRITRNNKSKILLFEQNQNKHIKAILDNPSLPIQISKDEIYKSELWLEMFIKDKWLKTHDLKKLSFNVNTLLNLAEKKSIILYTSDDALLSIGINPYAHKKQINFDDVSQTIITLDTNYGVANFKILTEQVILPILQKYDKSNLSKSLKVEFMYNFLGLRGNQITSTYPLYSLNNSINVMLFQELINDFDTLDNNANTHVKITNVNDEIINLRDILFIYDLIANNNNFSDNSLTPLFENYLKDPNSLGRNYMHYISKIDFEEIECFSQILEQEIDPISKSYKKSQKQKIEMIALQELENDILFFTFHKSGKLWFRNKNNRTSKIEVTDPNFLIITSLSKLIF